MTSIAHALPRARAGLALALTLPLLALVPLVAARWDGADHVTTVVGLTALLGAAAPFAVLRARGWTSSTGYATAAALWGCGVTAAGLWPHATAGPVQVRHLALTAALSGLAVLGLRHAAAARAGSLDHSLVIDALMLASALATVGWDAVARAGLHGDGWWHATVAALVAVTAVHASTTTTLAVEHPRLRRTGLVLTVLSLGTAVAALSPDPRTARTAIVVALLAGLLGATGAPREVLRHGGQAASRATRRLETASVLPVPLLLADLALLVASPRADPVLFAFYLSVLAAFGLRHAATARAVDRSTAHLTLQALHDDLTGLANRAALHRALTGPDGPQCLVLLELAGLDDVNDVLGVTTGDALVRAAADEVRRVVEPLGATAYRPSGDQVAVLLPGDVGAAVRLAGDLVAAVAAAPARVDGAARFPLTAVAGVAPCPGTHDGTAEGAGGPAGDPMTALVHADIALRDARAAGRGRVSVYSGDVAAAHARRTLLRERLADAVRHGTVDVHYQPIVSFATGRVEKFEALARWDDAQLGRINPGEFIAVAEESNLVVALGEHVLRSAVRWADEAGVFRAGVGLTVNVSVVQLQSPGFADTVREVLTRHRLHPHLLTLELTESVFLDTDSPAERVVTELAGLGCSIAIDDFGTGYSAFGYLDRLPVHVLKIDRSLTSSLTESGNGRSVVTCVVDLATRLGMTVVVEGVETERQADACREMSAPLGQGWLYSAAVPRTALAEQLARTYPVPGPVTPRR